MDTRQQLIEGHCQLAEMTKAMCDDCHCSQRQEPYRCCHDWACELTMAFAEWRWGVELTPTGHPSLPLMGPEGCTAPPHLRPACSGHICEGLVSDAPLEYWELKSKMAKLETQL